MRNEMCWKVNAPKTLLIEQWFSMLKLQVEVPVLFVCSSKKK